MILTNFDIKTFSTISVFVLLSACATTSPPVAQLADNEAVAVKETCGSIEKCEDSLIQEYQYYLGLLSTIWIR